MRQGASIRNDPALDLSDRPRSFLFLQGPLSPLYVRLAVQLEAAGHRIGRINLCPGDWLHWRRPGAVDYRGTPADWPEFVRREMAARAVTDVILHGDRRPYHAAAIAAAHKRGARVFVTELGYLRPDWMTLERDAAGAASHFSRDPAVIEWLAVQSRPLDLVPRGGGDRLCIVDVGGKGLTVGSHHAPFLNRSLRKGVNSLKITRQ